MALREHGASMGFRASANLRAGKVVDRRSKAQSDIMDFEQV
jgi:hypothetical protein